MVLKRKKAAASTTTPAPAARRLKQRKKAAKQPAQAGGEAQPAAQARSKPKVTSPSMSGKKPPTSPRASAAEAIANLQKDAPRSILRRRPPPEPVPPPQPPSPPPAKRKRDDAADAEPKKKRRRKQRSNAGQPAAPKEPVPEEPLKNILIVAGTYDSTLAGWRYSTDTDRVVPSFALSAHGGYVASIATSPKWIVSAGSDEVLKLCDAKRMQQKGDCGTEGTATRTVIMGHHVLVVTTAGMLQVFETKEWETVWQAKGHRKPIDDVAVHPSGRLGLTVSADGFLKTWDFAKGRLALQIKMDRPASLVSFTPDGELFVLYAKPELRVYSAANAKMKTALKMEQEVHCIAFLDSRTLLCGREDGELELVVMDADGETLTSASTKPAHPGRVRGISVLGNICVSVCSEGELVVWNLTEGGLKEVRRLRHGARFTCVAVRKA